MDNPVDATAHTEEAGDKATRRDPSRRIPIRIEARIGSRTCGTAGWTAGAAYQEVGEGRNHKEATTQAAEDERITHVLKLETSPERMLAFGPGDLVSPLRLVGWREGRIQTAAHGKRCADIHDRRLGVGSAGRSVAASRGNQRLQADLLRSIGHRVRAVLDHALE